MATWGGVKVMVVEAVIPDVKGAVETLLAPEKAGTVVEGVGAAEVLLGFRTLEKRNYNSEI